MRNFRFQQKPCCVGNVLAADAATAELCAPLIVIVSEQQTWQSENQTESQSGRWAERQLGSCLHTRSNKHHNHGKCIGRQANRQTSSHRLLTFCCNATERDHTNTHKTFSKPQCRFLFTQRALANAMQCCVVESLTGIGRTNMSYTC